MNGRFAVLAAALAAAAAAGGLGGRTLWTRVRQSEEELARTRREVEELRRHAGAGDRIRSGSSRILEERLESLEREIGRGYRLHRLTMDEIEEVRRSLARDTERLSRHVLLPSVQVNARGSVGGGTIIQSREIAPGEFATYAVTAFHVVQKAVVRKDGAEQREPVEVRVYEVDGALAETVEGEILAYDEKKDIVLVKLKSRRKYTNVARLARRESLREITVFTPIYAVGCPLGHDPLPSPGEISTLHKEVNGERFWMMNAPTIFGNSGGGIFHRETHELVGISAMICTYDGFVSTPVPHLGIMVSLLTLYDWLDGQYLQFVYDPAFTPEMCERMKRDAARPQPPTTRVKIEY
jgi:S1-C subfamily serine protease